MLGTLPCPWEGCSILTVNYFFLISRLNISCSNLDSLLLHVTSCKDSLHLICSCPLSTEILWWGPLEHSLLQRGDLAASIFPHRTGFPVLWLSLWPSFENSPLCLCLFSIEGPELDTVSRYGLTSAEWDDHISVSSSETGKSSSFFQNAGREEIRRQDFCASIWLVKGESEDYKNQRNLKCRSFTLRKLWDLHFDLLI